MILRSKVTLTTVEKGRIGELEIQKILISRGFNIFSPVADVNQVDLLVEIHDGVFSRCQIKSIFVTHNKSSVDVKLRQHSGGKIDVIGIYYYDSIAEKGITAFIPYAGEDNFILAVKNAKNNQQQSRKWIYAYDEYPEHLANKKKGYGK